MALHGCDPCASPVSFHLQTLHPDDSLRGLWQDTKIYLSHLKDIFKSPYAILGNAAAPSIIYEIGTLPSAQSLVPLAKVWAQIDCN